MSAWPCGIGVGDRVSVSLLAGKVHLCRQRPTIRLFDIRSLAAKVHSRIPFDCQQDNNSIFGGKNSLILIANNSILILGTLAASLIRSPTIQFAHWPIGKLAAKVHFGRQRANNSIRSKSSFCSPPTITIRRFGPWPPLDRKQFDFDHKSLPAKVRFDRQQFDHWLKKFL